MKGIPQMPHLRCAVNEAQLIPKLRHEGGTAHTVQYPIYFTVYGVGPSKFVWDALHNHWELAAPPPPTSVSFCQICRLFNGSL